ncbi:3',5'-nucleoside bisphosphate phosphatase [Thiobacter aerophilum]|uniref:3',5'-nucleoside bisphosphate phosphatase n=1 Tax=Thiobacter aerophilum TaxID=3121275 RepID=A0ABV0EE42_9BURK
MFSVDLHAHSRISDGQLAPRELVRHAAARGVRVLALTDHDDVAGVAEAREEASCQGMHLVSGVEISVTWRGRTIHVVGLRIDETHPVLQAGLARLRASRVERARRIAQELERIGISGSLEGAMALASEHIISRTHFARFLIEQGHAADMRGVFRKYLVKGKPGYVEHIWAGLDEAVAWIQGAGGVAVIAHPGRYDLGPRLMRELFAEFLELGGCAVEVVSGSHSQDEILRFAQLAREFGFKASRGSDYHGPGHGYVDMGRLAALPPGCVPVWHDWPEVLPAAA